MALTKPFAENGNKTTIPATTSDGSVSYDQGFGSFYALPPEEGGLFIDRAQFNQLMYDTTSAVIDNSDNITTIQGDVATAKVNITALQRDVNALESDVSNIESTISQVISSNVAPIGVYKTVENKTIGTNGDFKTIQEAFTYAQTHQKQGTNQFLRLTLLENLSGDLVFRGGWYPYVQIDCNGFKLGDNLTISYSSFSINNLKLNGGVIFSSSIIAFSGDISITTSVSEGISACIEANTNTLLRINANSINLTPAVGLAGIKSTGNSMVAITGAITQTTGNVCVNCAAGGIIQLYASANLMGVTVPKAIQAANTPTANGIIFGNYSL